MAVTTEHWINRDNSEGEYVIDIQAVGFNPYRHGPHATLAKIVREAKKAIRTAEKLAADDKASTAADDGSEAAVDQTAD